MGKLLLLSTSPTTAWAAWTLQFEMYFYTICAAAILIFPRRIRLSCGLVCGYFLGMGSRRRLLIVRMAVDDRFGVRLRDRHRFVVDTSGRSGADVKDLADVAQGQRGDEL
ncbi:hypothetical protein ACFSQT_27110 [Mesorhizobium calcicola]|uniref:Uncharacterized protein n=1 Tax=Mesorhizobium calcicola TaxID=1300310 RepID=A0ABW4WJ69_9HYPH